MNKGSMPGRAARCMVRICCGLAVLTLGCQDGPTEHVVKVSGKITLSGQPLTVERADVGLGMVKLQFWPVADGPNAIPYETVVEQDGRYTLFGKDGFGIPPGKYKIAVYQFDPYPVNDKLKGKFDVRRTPLEREVVGAKGYEQTIDIDLANPA